MNGVTNFSPIDRLPFQCIGYLRTFFDPCSFACFGTSNKKFRIILQKDWMMLDIFANRLFLAHCVNLRGDLSRVLTEQLDRRLGYQMADAYKWQKKPVYALVLQPKNIRLLIDQCDEFYAKLKTPPQLYREMEVLRTLGLKKTTEVAISVLTPLYRDVLEHWRTCLIGIKKIIDENEGEEDQKSSHSKKKFSHDRTHNIQQIKNQGALENSITKLDPKTFRQLIPCEPVYSYLDPKTLVGMTCLSRGHRRFIESRCIYAKMTLLSDLQVFSFRDLLSGVMIAFLESGAKMGLPNKRLSTRQIVRVRDYFLEGTETLESRFAISVDGKTIMFLRQWQNLRGKDEDFEINFKYVAHLFELTSNLLETCAEEMAKKKSWGQCIIS